MAKDWPDWPVVFDLPPLVQHPGIPAANRRAHLKADALEAEAHAAALAGASRDAVELLEGRARFLRARADGLILPDGECAPVLEVEWTGWEG